MQAHGHLINSDSAPDGGLDDFSSRHPGGANCVFADGAVHFVKEVRRDAGAGSGGATIYLPESLRLQALLTRSGGEVIGGDAF